MRAVGAVAATLAAAGSAALLGASDPLPVGPQFQVNSYTTNLQRHPAIAVDADGDFVVVWQSLGSSGDDSDGYSIQGQRYAASGTPLGSEFQVNSFTTSYQNLPAIAADADGDFVVAWPSLGSSAGDTDSSSIQGQRYAASGVPSGSQFQVNGYTTNAQGYVAIAAGANGDFVVVWESIGSSGSDTSNYSIQGQRFFASGAPSGGQFQVNSYTTGAQGGAAIAAEPGGDFVVVWHSNGSSGGDTVLYSIQGQRYAASGTLLGNQFQVNSYTTSTQRIPAIAVGADGDFVVVWESTGSSGSDTDGYSIQGQRHAVIGGPSGGQFQVNGYSTSNERAAAIAADVDGDFVVVWWSDGSDGGDTSSFSIQGQRYAASGTPSGSQFQVNSYTTSAQEFPAIAADSDGDFVVVWESSGSSGGDTDEFSIQGQRFRVTGDLQGRVFLDQDSDGIEDISEPGIAGITVELYDLDLELRRTAVTDANGNYAIKPKQGFWILRFVPPSSGFTFTAQNVGADDTVDSDPHPQTGSTDLFPIFVNALDDTIDAGFLPNIFVDGFGGGNSSTWSATVP